MVVYRAENGIEASLIKSRLEELGIPVLERGESVGLIYGLTVGPLAVIDILVPSRLWEEAFEALRAEGELRTREEEITG